MSTYLVVKYNNSNKSYTAKDNIPNKPYINISNKYFPLTTETSGTGIKVKINNNIYKIIESYTTSSTYTELSSSTVVGNSSTSNGQKVLIIYGYYSKISTSKYSNKTVTTYMKTVAFGVSNTANLTVYISTIPPDKYNQSTTILNNARRSFYTTATYENTQYSKVYNSTVNPLISMRVNAYTLSNNVITNGQSGVAGMITTSSYRQIVVKDPANTTKSTITTNTTMSETLQVLVTNITKSTIPKTSTYSTQ